MKRLISVVTMICYLSACTGWKTTPVAPEQSKVLRLTLTDGKRVLVHDAQAIGDSIVGFSEGSWSSAERVRVAYAKEDVRQVQKRGVSAGNTILLGAAVAVVVVGIIGVLSINTADPYH